MDLFFDVETSGFINGKLEASAPGQAWIMQIAFILSDEKRIYTEFSSLIKSNGRLCHPGAQAVHKITTEECDKGGMEEEQILDNILHGFLNLDRTLIAHNITFDIVFIKQLLLRANISPSKLRDLPTFCTMRRSTDLCQLPGKFGRYKWPKLIELYKFLFDEEMEGAHDALADVRATRKCYYRLKEIL